MTENDDLLAIRYAFGVSDLAEMTRVEARMLTDHALSAEINRYQILLSDVEAQEPGVTPPASVWDRIEQAIDDIELSPKTQTVRAASLAWEPFLPGVERKILFVDKAAALSGVLYRVAAGTEVGNHSHGVIEECLVLDGEIEIDGITVRTGDLHIAFPGVRHGPLRSQYGATVYIRGDLEIHV